MEANAFLADCSTDYRKRYNAAKEYLKRADDKRREIRQELKKIGARPTFFEEVEG